jgi:cell division protein FtsI (penicillin-binding protein 3)
VNIKNSILLRVRLAFLPMLLFGIAIVYKIGTIQFVEGDKWRSLAAEIGLEYRSVSATRGNIISDNGSLLATSIPFYKLALDPSRATDIMIDEGLDSLASKLSSFYGDNSISNYKQRILDARKSGKKYVLLNRELIDYQEKKKMETWPIFREGRMDGGVLFTKVDKRFRPFGYLGQRSIGFINENGRGAGLEYSFNTDLAGLDGKALYRKTVGGKWRPIPDASEVRPVDGYDLETTIDINLQDIAESSLLKALSRHKADYGTVVVMEVTTGHIKAIANLSKNANDTYSERYNYAVGSHGLREPGSTFKLVTMLALLEDSNLKLTDSIDTGDGVEQFYEQSVKDHVEGGYGKITIKEAFEQSSNIAMAKLADEYYGLKPQKYYNHLVDYGLTNPMGFQMVGEGVPKVKKPEDWSGITLPWMAHGYGLEITPLHTLTMFNAVANNGVMVKPMIIKRISKAEKEVNVFKTSVINKEICSEQTLLQIKELLEGVVEKGTANNINDANYRIAGKTGTAQTLKNGKYQKQYMTSFAGYFPAEAPQYSIIVVIENPRGVYQYGSSVAAPVFKEIADQVYAKNVAMHDELAKEFKREFGIFPVIKAGYQDDLTTICNEIGVSNHAEEDAPWVLAKIKDNSIDWKKNVVQEGLTPNVVGMTLRDAIYVLESTGFRVNISGEGRVKKQSIIAGKRVRKGDIINIELG